MRLENTLRWRVLLLAIVAGAAVACLSAAPEAQAKLCWEWDPEHNKEICVEPGPPPPPHCPLDPPLGYICVPGPTAAYVFEGVDPTDPATEASTRCTALLEGATPADPTGAQRVQFRTVARCDRSLQAASLSTRLVDSSGRTVATGPSASCHTDWWCGTSALVSRGDVSGLPMGAYAQIATVRFVLREPGAVDPWVVTPGTSPSDTPTSCTPGRVDVRCEVRLDIPPPVF